MLTDQEKQERREKAITLLSTLGNTADEIAESLQKLGIKGKICRSLECPLGIFLAREGVSLYDVHNDGNELIDWTEFYKTWKSTYDVILQFTGRFDRGQYFDLIYRDDEEEYDMD